MVEEQRMTDLERKVYRCIEGYEAEFGRVDYAIVIPETFDSLSTIGAVSTFKNNPWSNEIYYLCDRKIEVLVPEEIDDVADERAFLEYQRVVGRMENPLVLARSKLCKPLTRLASYNLYFSEGALAQAI